MRRALPSQRHLCSFVAQRNRSGVSSGSLCRTDLSTEPAADRRLTRSHCLFLSGRACESHWQRTTVPLSSLCCTSESRLQVPSLSSPSYRLPARPGSTAPVNRSRQRHSVAHELAKMGSGHRRLIVAQVFLPDVPIFGFEGSSPTSEPGGSTSPTIEQSLASLDLNPPTSPHDKRQQSISIVEDMTVRLIATQSMAG